MASKDEMGSGAVLNLRKVPSTGLYRYVLETRDSITRGEIPFSDDTASRIAEILRIIPAGAQVVMASSRKGSIDETEALITPFQLDDLSNHLLQFRSDLYIVLTRN